MLSGRRDRVAVTTLSAMVSLGFLSREREDREYGEVEWFFLLMAFFVGIWGWMKSLVVSQVIKLRV